MDKKREITVTVNGEKVSYEIEPRYLLADFLREKLRLTGTHLGCEHGVCGACTILLDGEPVRSCLTFAVEADEREVITIEGLTGENGELSDIQEAFWERHALQCGFCTPGFVITAASLLKENSNPSTDEIRDALSGNICRCTGYTNIIKAIEDVVKGRRA